MEDKRTYRQSERGNVMIIILTAIVLFVALNMVVANMTRDSSSQKLADSRSKLYAGEVLDYARLMAQAVQKVRISEDCTENEISFTRAGGDTYEHGVPVRDACKVFHRDGGDVVYQTIPTDTATNTDWAFLGNTGVDEIGTTCGTAACSDLIAVGYDIARLICLEINGTLGIDNPGGEPPTDTAIVLTTPFVGTYTFAQSVADEAGGANLSSKSAGCIREASGPNYVFYQVLFPR